LENLLKIRYEGKIIWASQDSFVLQPKEKEKESLLVFEVLPLDSLNPLWEDGSLLAQASENRVIYDRKSNGCLHIIGGGYLSCTVFLRF
jgi:hypothetical protein